MDGIELVGEAQRADQVASLVETRVADRGAARHRPARRAPDSRSTDGSPSTTRDVRVVMLTMSEDLDGALTALRDGASGYLVKGAGAERVEHALRAVAAGDVVLDHTPRSGR